MPTFLRETALSLLILIAGPALQLLADGLQDNIPAQVRPVPPQGIEVSPPDQAALKTGLEQLNRQIATLRKRDDARSRTLLAVVEIFARAVRDGLEHRELFSPRDVANAKKVLAEGRRRAEALLNGEAPWTRQKGLVVRGYRSRLDQTVQPYGLHVIGPGTKHAIHPDSLLVIEEKLERLAETGRAQLPLEIRFATFTLKYNRTHWLTLTQLGQDWEQARVTGKIAPEHNQITLTLRNVAGLRVDIPAGRSPFAPDRPVTLSILSLGPGGSPREPQLVTGLRPGTDRSWQCELHDDGGAWKLGAPPAAGPDKAISLRKRHDLQGPIDDAFMDSFLVVQPTGQARHPAVAQWTRWELERFVREWRRQFRGGAIVKPDVEITESDIAAYHLIVFGDPASNSVLAAVMPQLPIQWSADLVVVGDRKFDASHHAPVLIYPNPANPARYVVLNSGFTYREYAYLNNARQVPKLPDWAVVDLRTPADSLWPGRIAAADFFDEQWRIKP